jgi:thioredoxin 1
MNPHALPKTFDALITESALPVLVDFWAEWCGPCKMVSPAIERLASEYKSRIIAVKVNIDDKPHIAARYQISGIPTIMMFFKGQILMRQTGALSYEHLKSLVDQNLESK